MPFSPGLRGGVSFLRGEAIRTARGVDDGLIRLSVGIEDVADLQNDLRSALTA